LRVISHRGYWLQPDERNSVEAFKRSFALGFGTETDIRDLDGELVVSHDPPRVGALSFELLLKLVEPKSLPLALNVKADGLAPQLAAAMQASGSTNWFVFDMSIPDTRSHLAAGNPVYLRVSEYEELGPLGHRAAGIWFDAFEHDTWRLPRLAGLLAEGRPVSIVSPELHRRDHIAFWTELRDANLGPSNLLTLCTDFPEAAREFFEVTQ